MAGIATARIAFQGSQLFEVRIDEPGKISDSIRKLRESLMFKLNAHMGTNAVQTNEDDMLEELISDDDDAPKLDAQRSKGKGRKRSRGQTQQSPGPNSADHRKDL